MATRRPLFFSTDWSPEDMAHSDDIHLGKIVLDGVAGVAVDGGGMLAQNFAPPVDPDDLANKAYVDAVASGLDVHESVRVKTPIQLPDVATTAILDTDGLGTSVNIDTVIGAAVDGIDGNLLHITLVGDSPGAGGVTIDETALPLITIHYEAGVSTRALIEVAIALATNILVETAGSAVGFVTGGFSGALTYLTGGLDGWTASGHEVGKYLEASTDSSLNNVLDGYTLAVDDRVLVSKQGGSDATADIDNGVFKVTVLGNNGGAKFKMVRATDLDQDGELNQGVYVFVTDGTAGESTGWTCVTPDPIGVDTTPIKFSQFSGAAALTYDQGLKKVISSIQVDLDTDADAQTSGAGGGSSGLEFDADTASGQLRARVHATGGIERSATGLAVKIDDTPDTLDATSAGLKVVGVPDLFKVGGTATSQTPGTGQVTAGALNTITAGSSSNADSYHTHASSPATEAPVVENSPTVAAAITAGKPVYKDSTNGRVAMADVDTDTKAAVIGITRTAQPTPGSTVEMDSAGLSLGTITGLGFTAGQRLWLKEGGGLDTVAPSGAGRKKVVEMGLAWNTTDMFVRIIDRGYKAA